MPCQFCDIKQRTDHEHDTNKQHCPADASGATISIGIYAEQIGLPKPHEVLIRHEAIALNFVDLLFRNSSFPLRQLPAIIGVEAAGVIESVDSEVIGWAVGDRVGYYFSIEAYAEQRLIDPRQLVKLPDDINFDQAASLPAKRLTGRMLVKEASPFKLVILYSYMLLREPSDRL
ncbi:MAG: hypothetical protein BGO21_02700 [Dyadobacter sp. 50-39]|uniref:alcohol dehydrogenase catalytic domain-containing protein n=1 Tax=Dyadobacter sp. 50-39 TaxID=1895756 RepID=UPI0009663DB0|nr:MAG: hypothetical protein BGO21_02700 [Dyadobacter sp. 50-39]